MFGISKNIQKFLKKNMEKWKTTLMAHDEETGYVNIKREIFQGYSLPPLLFNISLISLSIILNKTGLSHHIHNKLEKSIISYT